MSKRLHRSISTSVRQGLTWAERWQGTDNGLITCWEAGRQLRSKDPDRAARADGGELVPLPFKGGTEYLAESVENKAKPGTLEYLAMWQGLRNQDLEIALEAETVIMCTRAKRSVVFRGGLIPDENE